MAKHILDRSSTTENGRLENALAIERQTRPRRAAIALQRRWRHRAQAARLVRFLRIARVAH